MSRFAFRSLLAAGVLSAAMSAPAAAQTPSEFGPTLEVHLRTQKAGGGLGMSGWANERFSLGSPLTFLVTAGSGTSELNVCGGGVGSAGSVADRLSRYPFVWEVKMVPSQYVNGVTTFDLEWARYQADSAGRASAEGKTTITLREGDRQQIDFVRGQPGARDCDGDAAIVEVGAGYKENASLAQTVLQYDLWLKHQQLNGQTITRKFTAMGRQGSDVDFVFAPLQFSLPQLVSDQPAFDLLTLVQGTIRGRLMPNGRIGIAVDTSRRDGIAARGTGPGGGSGNSGRKVIDVAADEPVEIELPVPGGQSSRAVGKQGAAAPRGATPPPVPKQAVSLDNGRIVVDNALFFQGQRTSIIVQVKPVKP